MANTFTDFMFKKNNIADLTHLKIPLEDVVKATNNFDDKNVIGEGDFGKVYKGQLLHKEELINISARRLDRKNRQGHIEFWTEISALSNLHEHPNIVSLIGFCDEKEEKIIINEYNAKGSLIMYLSDPTFTWKQRLTVCCRIEDAIQHIHANEYQSYHVIHCNINSSTILLDDNWNPKLSGFEYSIKHRKDRKNKVYLCEAIRTAGYMDPAIEKTGGVTHKTDIYTFGVVMFEILCGRKAFIPNENNEFLAPLARVHYENKTLKDIIDTDLWNGMTQFTYNSESFLTLAKAAYSCLEEERAARPTAFDLWRMMIGLDDDRKKMEYNQVTTGRTLKNAGIYRISEDPSTSTASHDSQLRVDSSHQHVSNNSSLDAPEMEMEDESEFEMEDESEDEVQFTLEDVADTRLRTELKEKYGKSLRIVYANYSEKHVSNNSSLDALEMDMENELEMEMEEDTEDEDQSTLEEVSDTRIRTELKEKSSDTLQIVSANNSEKVKKFDHLRIRYEHIELATDNFSVKISTFETSTSVSITELECFDKMYLSLIEGRNTGVLPQKKYTVEIRENRFKEDALQNVIETLSNCEHRNIESFLGFCEIRGGLGRVILVFEYVHSNYLRRYLDDGTLTWKKRLEICVDIAHGLEYLHSKMEDQKRVIHSKIDAWTIQLMNDRQVIITGLHKAIFLPPNQDDGAFYQDNGAYYHNEEDVYTDPEYAKTGKLTIKSDVYSFGVVMLQILCGEGIYKKHMRCRSDGMRYLTESERVAKVRELVDKGIIKGEMLPFIKEENFENYSFLNKGPNEDSLEIFLKVAYQCLAETPNERPSTETVVEKLKKALSFQENHKDPLRMPIEDIKLATKDFCNENVIGGGGFGSVYKGEVAHGLDNGNRIIVAKRLDTRGGQGEKQYYDELQILYEFKHENVIGLVGYSNEKHERVIVYEYAPRGSLDNYLNDDKLSWRMRLQICIDVASGLAFLHGGVQGKEVVIHRDLKAANILLFDDWKAKVADFGLSLISTINEETDYTIDHPCGTRGYIDPLYEKSGFLTLESDIYSFGVVLFEIMYGRPMYEIHKQKGQSLPNFIRQIFKENKQDELVFEAIKEHIVPKSLTTFQTIAYKCLHEDREKRPTSKEILEQLKMALEFQEENKM